MTIKFYHYMHLEMVFKGPCMLFDTVRKSRAACQAVWPAVLQVSQKDINTEHPQAFTTPNFRLPPNLPTYNPVFSHQREVSANEQHCLFKFSLGSTFIASLVLTPVSYLY